MNATTSPHADPAERAVALYLRGFIAPLIPAALLSLAALALL